MTNPTISPEELFDIGQNAARAVGGVAADQMWADLDPDIKEWLAIFASRMQEQIRQAEQAAYERAAQYIADKEARGESPVIAACASLWSDELRALAQEPENVG